MEKFTPFEKLSKRRKREIAKARRNTWGGINPVTRKVLDKKAYSRKKLRQQEDDNSSDGAFLLLCKIAVI